MHKFFTSESVTEGHPDKICDQVSDAVLDAILEQDPDARVACETACTTGMLLVMGEITTEAYVPIDTIARQVVLDIGYDRAKYGFDGNTCSVLTAVHEQSPDIAQGVNVAQEAKETQGQDLGAGDQGMMYGYACDETPELMPLPIALAHKITRRLAAVRKDGTLSWLRPDGKSQVTIEYEGDRPLRVDNVLVAAQHSPDIEHQAIESEIIRHVILPCLPENLIDRNTRYMVNATGRFVLGGPMGDSGLTGRKIIVDTYGGIAHHGGGAFSGKDPTKVDRSASYAARYIAKNIIAAKLARRCEVALSYAIGVAHPTSIRVDTFGTGLLPDEKLYELVSELFDLRPAAIIKSLDLRRPIYRQTAAYGHFGRTDIELPWEKTDRINDLRSAAGI